MLWSWYLSNDTQFFIAGAIVLIVGVRHFKFATVALSLFLVSSWVTTGEFYEVWKSTWEHFNDPVLSFEEGFMLSSGEKTVKSGAFVVKGRGSQTLCCGATEKKLKLTGIFINLRFTTNLAFDVLFQWVLNFFSSLYLCSTEKSTGTVIH